MKRIIFYLSISLSGTFRYLGRVAFFVPRRKMNKYVNLASTILLTSFLLAGCSVRGWNPEYAGGTHVVIELESSGDAIKDEKNTIIMAQILNGRLDHFGIPAHQRVVTPLKGGKIVIQLPKIKYSEKVVALVSTIAFLELRIVSDNEEFFQKAMRNEEVPGLELKSIRERTGEEALILVQKEPIVTGAMLKSAEVKFNEKNYGQPYLSVEFNEEGTRKLAEGTGRNIGQRMAIILDGDVLMAPVIRETIPTGRIMINTTFSLNEAKDLSLRMLAGATPARTRIIEEGELTEELWIGDNKEDQL